MLWTVLLINAAFFIIEIIAGLLAGSMGLVADSLDMFADAIVYGMAIYAVHKSSFTKKKVARISGYLQLALAIFGIAEVIRRYLISNSLPDHRLMIWISAFAFIGNAICFYLLQKHKNPEAHIVASKIFTGNDVLMNLGVIIAGVLVFVFHSFLPDLVIGTLVFALIFRGILKIFRISKN